MGSLAMMSEHQSLTFVSFGLVFECPKTMNDQNHI